MEIQLSSFANKVAIVTGGGQGIGKAIARFFLNAGIKVAVSQSECCRIAELGQNLRLRRSIDSK
ncbi:SDR family NAD(P)-dependent oxidoreductase [Pleurocapsales cyanobacterium LEGE 06147]|nr:SDR family NAD(P)-dependent oxidoreductase [Pleurocapsales cyanobacterium LEGE 06147]